MITSTRNPHVQWVRKLQERPAERREGGMFVVEGVRLAEEALATSSASAGRRCWKGLPPRVRK
jgi:hypothetical protein